MFHGYIACTLFHEKCDAQDFSIQISCTVPNDIS